MLPTDRNDPTLPTENDDPLEQIDRNESSDRHDHFELPMVTACLFAAPTTSASDPSTSRERPLDLA